MKRSLVCFALVVGTLSYAFAQAPAVNPAPDPAVNPAPDNSGVSTSDSPPLKTYIVPAGTKIPLSLQNEISTRSARPGDGVYLVSTFPVVADGVVVLPAGMYVRGLIDAVQRPGKVKGRAQLQMHFTSMILPNGVSISIALTMRMAPA
jgi:type IV secretion system protein VirB10